MHCFIGKSNCIDLNSQVISQAYTFYIFTLLANTTNPGGTQRLPCHAEPSHLVVQSPGQMLDHRDLECSVSSITSFTTIGCLLTPQSPTLHSDVGPYFPYRAPLSLLIHNSGHTYFHE